MALCIIDFIGANAFLGPVGGRGPWTLLGNGAIRIIGQKIVNFAQFEFTVPREVTNYTKKNIFYLQH